MGTIKEIIKFINEEKNNFRKVIKIYIIKLIFNSKKVNKNFKELNKIDFKKLEYDFINEMLKKGKEKDIIKEIIEEKNLPTNEKYYYFPYLKFFTYSIDKQSEKDYFIEQFESNKNNINKFPLIYKFIEEIKNNKLY